MQSLQFVGFLLVLSCVSLVFLTGFSCFISSFFPIPKFFAYKVSSHSFFCVRPFFFDIYCLFFVWFPLSSRSINLLFARFLPILSLVFPLGFTIFSCFAFSFCFVDQVFMQSLRLSLPIPQIKEFRSTVLQLFATLWLMKYLVTPCWLLMESHRFLLQWLPIQIMLPLLNMAFVSYGMLNWTTHRIPLSWEN